MFIWEFSKFTNSGQYLHRFFHSQILKWVFPSPCCRNTNYYPFNGYYERMRKNKISWSYLSSQFSLFLTRWYYISIRQR
ncbi:unnamed protein product [Paramecium octaurelia]|uniref:Uncharacterized protein n=1 Tax=Paramecium octaurelia TaxID=43137 RepID=A0A8S1TAG7_PAROT|nr:unnamed protein product [Paramecium octaurelia]